MSPGLDVRDLTIASEDGLRVLDSATLQVRPGTIVAVRGPSGSGKSTLLSAVLGALPPGLRRIRGTVTWTGQPIPTGTKARRWRHREVGVCAQESGASLHPHHSVLSLAVEHMRDTPEARRHATELLAQLGLDETYASRKPGQLSGGQAQRVALCRALLPQPRLLILDEPTRGLDTDAAAAVHTQLAAARAAGTAVLIVTHDDRLSVLADDVVSLDPVHPTPIRPHTSRTPDRPRRVLLEINNLVLAQPKGATPVLRVEALEIHAGERVVILGPSGSGKTTMLRTIAGLHHPESGELRLNGIPLRTVRERDTETRAAVQVVGQNPYQELNPAHRVRTAVRRPLQLLRGQSRATAAEVTDHTLARLGLDPETHRRRPSAISGGQRQRVSLARALAVGPALLLADEPTSALDAATTTSIIGLIDEACNNGLTVLLATHDETLTHWADRTLRIVDGALVEVRPPFALPAP
ncbi:MAG: ABC transporter ATP-binding protein [Tessaracoccus sp.]|uniref:ABC transporter ATP-binding protein n=1 Tax=Tessaracoccus sp. TaxID=1971211 RepID=UPI001ECD3D02|nr:ATP-binding cassette domain-containing protein [Tessaracoccus sp.]MBK7821966.1 ABC transporter ATP-binding protein [Tessaracoccus sp.]